MRISLKAVALDEISSCTHCVHLGALRKVSFFTLRRSVVIPQLKQTNKLKISKTLYLLKDLMGGFSI